jgi:two-component system cell cycle response regulator DivK
VKRILVVEDDAFNALLFRKVLERRGSFVVTVCESAEEIVTLVREGHVDLVIMDVSLANTTWEGRPLSGIELCEMLKSDPATARVPVVLATAHAMRGDAEAFQSMSKADGYVSKPIMDHGAFVEQILRLCKEAA